MENLLKEKFERLVIDAPKDGIGNAQGMMKYITDLMQSAYDLAKSEDAEAEQKGYIQRNDEIIKAVELMKAMSGSKEQHLFADALITQLKK